MFQLPSHCPLGHADTFWRNLSTSDLLPPGYDSISGTYESLGFSDPCQDLQAYDVVYLSAVSPVEKSLMTSTISPLLSVFYQPVNDTKDLRKQGDTPSLGKERSVIDGTRKEYTTERYKKEVSKAKQPLWIRL
jgi:hypothetical protein